MGRYNAVPYGQYVGKEGVRPANSQRGLPDGAVPYISWPAGEEVEDTVAVDGDA